MVRAPITLFVGLIALGAVACGHKIGDDCKTSVDCSQGGERLCDITQPGGYCTIFNCEPNSCPSEAACVVFDPQLAPDKACVVTNGLSRFARSFCLFKCSSDGDCRDDYVCQDFSRDEPNDWNGIAVDTDRGGKVCVAKRKIQSFAVSETLPPSNVCNGPAPVAGLGGSGGSAGNSSGGSSSGGASSGGASGAGGADDSSGGAEGGSRG